MKRQNYWIDRTMALCLGLLPLLSSVSLTGVLRADVPNWAFNSAILGVSLLLVGIMGYRLWVKSYAIRTNLTASAFYDRFKEQIRPSCRVVICSPDSSLQSKDFIAYCCEHNVGISILGSSSQMKMLVETLSYMPAIHDKLNVTRFSNEFSMVVLYDTVRSRVCVGSISRDDGMLIQFSGRVVEKEIRRIVEAELLGNGHPIQLGGIAHPQVFLRVIDQKTRDFLDNFSNLKSGEITFYKSEVLNIQSGWLENGDFRLIRTLDRTTNPELLLGRMRYLQANEAFVARTGNAIQRVFMIDRLRLSDPVFCSNLEALAFCQIDMGIEIDVRILDDLGRNGDEDFILYDHYAVLVEKAQADASYHSGRSTAYFGHEKIKSYDYIFNAVWRGGRTKEQISKILRG